MRRWSFIPAVMLLAACAAPPPAPVDDYSLRPASPAPEEPPDRYTVERGDTLYSIAFRFGADVKDLAAWNGIDAPYTIFPGQELNFRPAEPVRTAGAAASAGSGGRVRTEPLPEHESPERTGPEGGAAGAGDAARTQPDEADHAPPPASQPTRAPKPAATPDSANSGPLQWQWPARGPVLSSFDAGDASRKGINIGGKSGDPVYAAASGTVVYSGSGLIGYGELIIVKHDDRLLSAYGHNRKRLVQEGEHVRAGQRVAEMGSTGAPRPMLHFEIRVEGKPVNPAKYLPSR